MNGVSWRGRNELPSRLIRERICSKEDLQFIGLEAPEFQRQFLRDRKILMLLCLQQMRAVTVEAVRIHRTAASVQASVKPTVELRLAGNYLAFLLLWESACILVWMTNPVVMQSVTARVFAAAAKLSYRAGHLVAANPSLGTNT